VSKYNYCFSDFPFPDETPDYPHNTDMAKYIVNYVKNFKLEDHIRFFRKVLNVEKEGMKVSAAVFVGQLFIYKLNCATSR